MLGTVNVLEKVKQNNLSKFVYAASSSCYGIAHTPTDEEHKIDPIYPVLYQNTKENSAPFIGQKFIKYQLIQLEFLMHMEQESKPAARKYCLWCVFKTKN